MPKFSLSPYGLIDFHEFSHATVRMRFLSQGPESWVTHNLMDHSSLEEDRSSHVSSLPRTTAAGCLKVRLRKASVVAHQNLTPGISNATKYKIYSAYVSSTNTSHMRVVVNIFSQSTKDVAPSSSRKERRPRTLKVTKRLNYGNHARRWRTFILRTARTSVILLPDDLFTTCTGGYHTRLVTACWVAGFFRLSCPHHLSPRVIPIKIFDLSLPPQWHKNYDHRAFSSRIIFRRQLVLHPTHMETIGIPKNRRAINFSTPDCQYLQSEAFDTYITLDLSFTLSLANIRESKNHLESEKFDRLGQSKKLTFLGLQKQQSLPYSNEPWVHNASRAGSGVWKKR